MQYFILAAAALLLAVIFWYRQAVGKDRAVEPGQIFPGLEIIADILRIMKIIGGNKIHINPPILHLSPQSGNPLSHIHRFLPLSFIH